MAELSSAGKMNQRIHFNKVTHGKNDYGQVVDKEETIYSCWSEIRSQYLQDIESSIGTDLEDTITFIIRYTNKDITNDMTVKHGEDTYKITKITPDIQDKKFTTIIAKKVS
ncbi:phage head closure protein [Barrientosiimonas marina]|uniref:Phage head closure protein n=1 Tax=Lentibacillus kimchii TaxID=1542911 RepID=A0ABW2UYF7_9BACI